MDTKFIKTMRRKLDSLLTFVIVKEKDKVPVNSVSDFSDRHYRHAVIEVEKGRMWLGQALHAAGEPYPYDQSRNTANNTVHEATDTADGAESPELDSDIKVLKHIRSRLQDDALIRLGHEVETPMSKNKLYLKAINRAYEHLQTASMMFGSQLDMRSPS